MAELKLEDKINPDRLEDAGQAAAKIMEDYLLNVFLPKLIDQRNEIASLETRVKKLEIVCAKEAVVLGKWIAAEQLTEKMLRELMKALLEAGKINEQPTL